MPKSKSNRDLLAAELQELVLRYQEKPSTLLEGLEDFIRKQGIQAKKSWTPKREPTWKVMGFKSKAAMTAFENRTDFPGWDAL